MYEYELKIIGPKKSIYFYKDNVEIYKGEPSISANEDVLLEEAYLTLQQSYSDIRANSKRKGSTNTTNTTNTTSQPISGTTSTSVLKGVLYEYRGYRDNSTIYVEIKYMGEVIETREFASYFEPMINGVTYKGIEGALKSVEFSVKIFGTFANGISYPPDTLKPNISDSITANIPQVSINTSEITPSVSGVTFNSVKDEDLKKAKKDLEDRLEILQNLGLPPIKLIPKTIWEKVIEPKLLTKRQIIKKIVMITNQSLPIPVSEEDAQLIVYGKVYYKDGVLYDNDKEDPACVSHPGDPDYHKPIDENHPLWKAMVQKIEDIKNALKQLGVKLGEFAFLIPQTIQTIAVSLTAMVSSLVILPFGAGIPTAMTAVQNIITAIKQLQSKAAEFLPLIAAIETIGLLLPKEAQSVIAALLGPFKLIINIIMGITLILGLIDIITKLLERLRRKMMSAKLSVKAKADPSSVKKGESTILSVEVSGGDYDYIYEWTDSQGNVITKDPNSGEDDGTREITPEIPILVTKSNIVEKPNSVYTCKVTDQKGKGTSEVGTVKVYRD